jgi:hypothetical protein
MVPVQSRCFGRPSARAAWSARAAFAIVGLVAWPALAEVGSAARPINFLTPGPSFEMGLDGSMRFGGELALAQYSGGWAAGAALGFVSNRLYIEAQPALALGTRHSVVVGLNPGVVIDVTGNLPHYGGQATVWSNYVHAGDRRWASPVFPFVRVQAVLGMGLVFTGGLMLKLPLPIS